MWEPAGFRIMVRPDDPPDKIGSLYVPNSVKASRAVENVKGTIVSIGKKAWKAFDDGEAWCEIGDRVCFAKYGGFIVEDEVTKEQFRILNDEDIISIWRDDA
jgi:co-chaperonin GroES (HSP10)